MDEISKTNDDITNKAGSTQPQIQKENFYAELPNVPTQKAGNGDDTIWGGNGNGSMLFGDAGNDWIDGGTGDDFIIGGYGNDKLYGNGGNDTFIFGAENWGIDAITQTNGTVTLWFAEGNENKWDAETMTYQDGENRVAVNGIAEDKVTLKFGDDGSNTYDMLADAGAFDETKDQKIYTTIA